ncbi:MAG: GIY-YIG nuclease family protein [Alphaproteobacteria bacterium]|nr:GIY-YIG nuclease family protein [Alphaproteobacteria bacterium]
MAKQKNKNIIPVKDLSQLEFEISYEDFQYKDYFIHLCNLIPKNEEEKLEIEVVNEQQFDTEGLVYVFVINDKIFKIGHTITSIKKRVQSYNCGKTEYRIAGTNSTTNYFVLQSLLKINQPVKVFAFFPEQPKYTLFGKEYQDSFPTSKRAENEILKNFIQKYNKKPIGCTQT